MAVLSHPDLPFELEHVGQEVVCRYPEGATAIASRAEWLAMQILIKLDELIENRLSTPVEGGDLVLEQVLEVADQAVDDLKSTKKKAK